MLTILATKAGPIRLKSSGMLRLQWSSDVDLPDLERALAVECRCARGPISGSCFGSWRRAADAGSHQIDCGWVAPPFLRFDSGLSQSSESNHELSARIFRLLAAVFIVILALSAARALRIGCPLNAGDQSAAWSSSGWACCARYDYETPAGHHRFANRAVGFRNSFTLQSLPPFWWRDCWRCDPRTGGNGSVLVDFFHRERMNRERAPALDSHPRIMGVLLWFLRVTSSQPFAGRGDVSA